MFACSNCHTTVPKWTGKCPTCGEWNTLEDIGDIKKQKGKGSGSIGKIQELQKILPQTSSGISRLSSTSGELDSVLGGGLTPGSLVLLSGEPGIGKSTLALQMSEWYGSLGSEILYISGEEHIGQISARASRLGVSHDNIFIITENDFDDIISTIRVSRADIIIIDSLSVMSSGSLEGTPGSMNQIRTMTEVFMQIAKTTQKSILLIGHVTKDGSIGGPKSLEHLVDVVLFLEGVRTENYRLLRAFKNRFGPTDAVGLFRMEESGLIDIPNPGLEFIDATTSSLAGSALTLTIEGNRPLLVEIEALTTYTKFGYPKRSSRGIPQGKLDLLIAVMTKFTDTKLESYDVYMNIGRGFSITEPGVDLACIAAMMSSRQDMSLGRTIFLGEVSLTGVVKSVFFLEKRITEAVKLGFTQIVIPEAFSGNLPKGVEYIKIGNIRDMKKIFI
ncbi:DNA repair protein RadA [Candidatus Gracilibacteria bacterium]|nr:DNA repair protein RadA [Candidatus Gracilibacteria bacterium]